MSLELDPEIEIPPSAAFCGDPVGIIMLSRSI